MTAPLCVFQVESMLAELTEEERAKLCPPEKDEALDPGGGNAAPAEQISSSRVDDAEQDFRVQVASFAELHDLTRDNRDALEELKGLLGSPVPATSSVGFPNGAERIDADKLRELDQLVIMAKALGEMVASETLAFSLFAQQRYAKTKLRLIFRIQLSGQRPRQPGSARVCLPLASRNVLGISDFCRADSRRPTMSECAVQIQRKRGPTSEGNCLGAGC